MSSAIIWMVLTVSCRVTHSYNNQSWNELYTRIESVTSGLDEAPWMKAGTKVKVGVSVAISAIKSHGLLELETTFHLAQTWLDNRLSYNASSILSEYSLLGQNRQNHVWTPDLYPENTLSTFQHDVTMPNLFIKIYPNGTVFKSNRLTVRFPCTAGSKLFPHGKQICSLQFKSYAFTRDNINLVWIGNGVRTLGKFTATKAMLTHIAKAVCDDSVYTEGQPCLEMSLSLVVDHDKYFIRIYLPSTVFVVLSYLSLWIDKAQVAARTTLGVVCLLSIVTQSLGLMMMTTEVDGVVAVDIWMGMCLIFTAAAFVIFTIVHNIKRSKDKWDIEKEDNKEVDRGRGTCCIRHQRFQNAARTIFPIAFLIFNLVYWPMILL